MKKERKVKARRMKTTVGKKMEKKRRRRKEKKLGRTKLMRRLLLLARIEMWSFERRNEITTLLPVLTFLYPPFTLSWVLLHSLIVASGIFTFRGVLQSLCC